MKKLVLIAICLLWPFAAFAQVDDLYTVELNLGNMIIDPRDSGLGDDVKSILVDVRSRSRSFLLNPAL